MTAERPQAPGAPTIPETIEEDARQVSELGSALPTLDLDGTTAEQIARRARESVGKPPSRRRWILPIVAAGAAIAYAVWTLLNVLDVLR